VSANVTQQVASLLKHEGIDRRAERRQMRREVLDHLLGAADIEALAEVGHVVLQECPVDAPSDFRGHRKAQARIGPAASRLVPSAVRLAEHVNPSLRPPAPPAGPASTRRAVIAETVVPRSACTLRAIARNDKPAPRSSLMRPIAAGARRAPRRDDAPNLGYRQVLRYWAATPARCGYASSGSRHRGASVREPRHASLRAAAECKRGDRGPPPGRGVWPSDARRGEAIGKLLELHRRAIELADHEERLAYLEQRLTGR
jgi:hypothetical protein